MRNDFERIRTVYEFRTSAQIRAYGFCGILTLGITWSPYFASLSHTAGALWVGIYAIVLTNLVLATLFEVYLGLEDPFDDDGDDDLNFAWIFEIKSWMFQDSSRVSYQDQSGILPTLHTNSIDADLPFHVSKKKSTSKQKLDLHPSSSDQVISI